MAIDSYTTSAPSRRTGTCPRGFMPRNPGVLCSPFENWMRCDSYGRRLTSRARSTRHEKGLPLAQKISIATRRLRLHAALLHVLADDDLGELRHDLPDDLL